MVQRWRKTIKKLTKMVLNGPDECVKELETFSALVDELSDHSWRLSPQQSHFLDCLVRLRTKMVVDAPFILFVEEALQ
jgi:hypothetical protein